MSNVKLAENIFFVGLLISSIPWTGNLPADDALAQPLAQLIPAPENAELHEALAELISASIPAEYEDNKHWDQTKRVYAGVKLRKDDWKWETKRQYNNVNHGSWYRSRLRLVDPHKNLQVTALPLILNADRRYVFDISVLADVAIWGQWARWNYGVQLISLQLDGNATIELRIKGTIGFKLEGAGAIPDVAIDPHVDQATITLHHFKLDHVSDIGGEVAQQIGRLTKKALEEQFISPQQERLSEKLNQKIEQKRQRLRVSPSRWFEQWLVGENL